MPWTGFSRLLTGRTASEVPSLACRLHELHVGAALRAGNNNKRWKQQKLTTARP